MKIENSSVDAFKAIGHRKIVCKNSTKFPKMGKFDNNRLT